MKRDQLAELMADFVTDGLSREEHDAVVQRIDAGDEQVLAALANALDAYAQAGDALEPIEPAADVWERVAAKVARQASKRPARRAGAVTADDQAAAGPARPFAWPPSAWAALAAAAMLALAALVWGVTERSARLETQRQLAQLTTDRDDALQRVTEIESQLLDAREQGDATREELRLLAADLDETRVQLAALNDRAEDDAQRLAFFTSPTLHIDRLAGTDEQPDAAGRMAWDARLQRFRFEADGLTPVAADRTYQLWAIPAEGDPISLGTFIHAATGRTVYEGDLPGLTAAPAAVAVSLEPQGGTPQPTGAIQLLGEITSVQ